MGEIAELQQANNVIYKIENLVNGHIYIGSAKDYYNRMRLHRHYLRKGKHHSVYLQRAFNKYGEEYLLFSILEFCDNESVLIEREQYHIDSLTPQYNICKKANSRLGSKLTKAQSERLSISRKGRKVGEKEVQRRKVAFKGNKIAIGNKNRRKVTKEIMEQIYKLKESGLGCRRIANLTGLNKTTILNVVNKKFLYG